MEWKTLKFSDKLFKINTRTIDLKNMKEELVYLDIDAVKSGAIVNPKKLSKKNLPSRARRLVKEGDVLIASVRPYLKSFAVVPKEYENCIASTGFFVIERSENIEPRYLLHFAMSEFFINQTNELVQGGSYPALNKEQMGKISIPIPFKNGKPDITEQKRIVSELDKILLLQKKAGSDIQRTDSLFISICKESFEKGKVVFEKKKISDECHIIKGQSPTQKTIEGEYTFVVTSEKRKSANTFQFDGEAVCIPLVSSTGHGHASLHRIHYQKGKFALANIMVALVPKNGNSLMAKYLYYYLSFYKNELLVPLMRGVANVTIPLYKINDVVAEIPKIKQQAELVTTLEGVERLKQNLLRRRELIERCFQSTLDREFSGKL